MRSVGHFSIPAQRRKPRTAQYVWFHMKLGVTAYQAWVTDVTKRGFQPAGS